MEANELMIDDLVLYKGKMPCKITAICKDTAVVDNDTGQDWRIDYDKLTPIPLTTDILKKIGFGYVENDVNPYDGKVLSHFYLGDECFCANMDLHICTDNDGIFWFSSPKLTLNGIRYLHELQHALRLGGIKKEIEL